VAGKATRKRADLSGLSAVLDRRSYEWLGDEDAELLNAIEIAVVGNGAGAGEIRRHVLQVTGRPAIALRCEQAARHIARGE